MTQLVNKEQNHKSAKSLISPVTREAYAACRLAVVDQEFVAFDCINRQA